MKANNYHGLKIKKKTSVWNSEICLLVLQKQLLVLTVRKKVFQERMILISGNLRLIVFFDIAGILCPTKT